jgi:hypothetical protein
VGIEIEILFTDDLQNIPDHAVVPQHAAEHGAFSIETLRRETVTLW